MVKITDFNDYEVLTFKSFGQTNDLRIIIAQNDKEWEFLCLECTGDIFFTAINKKFELYQRAKHGQDY